MNTSPRRHFLQRLSLAATTGLVLPCSRSTTLQAAVAAEPYHFLDLDNVSAGRIYAPAGGGAVGEVVQEQIGGDMIAKKHLGQVIQEEISLQVGPEMSPAFWYWIGSGFAGPARPAEGLRRNGAIIDTDTRYNSRTRLNFFFALLTELALPALDVTSKSVAKLGLRLQPEYTRRQVLATPAAYSRYLPPVRAKSWLAATFRLSISGLEASCAACTRIEPLILRQTPPPTTPGAPHDYEQETPVVTVPDLVITVPEAAAQPFYDWHQSFVVQGNSTDDQERSGTLELLASDKKTVLFSATFGHLGIYRVQPLNTESSIPKQRQVKISMYMETMTFRQGALLR